MGKSFQKITLCFAGNLGDSVGKIPQWIKANGGKYSRKITQDVTHLVTTKEAYKKNISAVKEAKRLGTVKIVSYDWLEDSLLSNHKSPKREKNYLIENLVKEQRKRGKGGARKTPKSQGSSTKRAARKLPEKGRGKGLSGSGRVKKANSATSGYHTYTDIKTHITYNATLVRQTITKRNEKFQLTIYESNNTPHTYVTECKYSSVGKSDVQLLAPAKSSLDTALVAFFQFFEEYTGKSWEQRQNGILPPPRRNCEGNLLPPHEGWFFYQNPTRTLFDFLRKGPEARDDKANSTLLDIAERSTVPSDNKWYENDQGLDSEIKEEIAGVANDSLC